MFKTTFDKPKTRFDRAADFLRDFFGTVWFLVANGIFFFMWLLLNSGAIPAVHVFDPYPHGLLTTIVSLEAIFLSIIVLISQNRTTRADELREELDLQINIKAEAEITKIINMLDEIHDHLGLPLKDDKELKKMKRKTNINNIEHELMRTMQ